LSDRKESATAPLGTPRGAALRREQTRARYPDAEGWLKRDGVRVFYEVYGAGEPAILLFPTWEIVHSRAWKAQIPYLARHGQVITFDRRGNGQADRPDQVSAYDRRATADDARAVLDHVGVEQAVVVSWCGSGEDLLLAATRPAADPGAGRGGSPVPVR
jgi:pimeloyl-ACP methyl ester carboxylesterase